MKRTFGKVLAGLGIAGASLGLGLGIGALASGAATSATTPATTATPVSSGTTHPPCPHTSGSQSA